MIKQCLLKLKNEKSFAGTNKRPRCVASACSKRPTGEPLNSNEILREGNTCCVFHIVQNTITFSMSHLRCGILQRILPKQTLVGLVVESVLSGDREKAPGDTRRSELKWQTKFLTGFLPSLILPKYFIMVSNLFNFENFLLFQRFWSWAWRSW